MSMVPQPPAGHVANPLVVLRVKTRSAWAGLIRHRSLLKSLQTLNVVWTFEYSYMVKRGSVGAVGASEKEQHDSSTIIVHPLARFAIVAEVCYFYFY
jgi:hypothetical protein